MRLIERQYRLLQSAYWVLFCVSHAYITYYLTAFSFSTGEIGALTAFFGTLAAVVQIGLGKVADSFGRWDWKNLLLVMSALTLAVTAALCVSRGKWLTGLLFGLFFLLVHAMMPFINAACFYYQHRGVELHFGIARGLGSFSYAVVAFLLGRVTARLGTFPVVAVAVADTLLLLGTVCCMRRIGGERATEHEAEPARIREAGEEMRAGSETEAAAPTALRDFVKRYPAFLCMVLGISLLLTYHNATGNYMLQLMENVGGGSAHMGTAVAIAAVVELPVLFGYSVLQRRTRPDRLLLVSGLVFVVRAALLWSARSVAAIYATQLLQLCSYALYAAASVYYADDHVAKEDAVTGQAFITGADTLGAVLGSLLGGLLLQAGGVALLLPTVLGITVLGALAIGASLLLDGKRSRQGIGV